MSETAASADPAAAAGRLLPDLGAAAAFAVVPAVMLGRAVGPYRAPGVEGEALYGAVLSAMQLRAGAPGAPWPASAAGAGLAAVLPADPAFAYGVVVATAVWLAGFGPWRLARRMAPEAPVWAAGAAALTAQLSPAVLRGVPEADFVALGFGAFALGLAHPRLAWLGGLWGVPQAAAFFVAGIGAAIRRDTRALPWLVAAAPLFALLSTPSELPGALLRTPQEPAAGPAYLTPAGAVLPLPPVEAEPVRAAAQAAGTGLYLPQGVESHVRANRFAGPVGHVPRADAPQPPATPPAPNAPASPPAGGEAALPAIGALLVPLQRVHAGSVAILGLLAALFSRRTRRYGAAGLLLCAGLVVALGWQAAPGEVERDPQAAAALVGLVSASEVPGSALAWGSLAVALGAPGVARALAGVAARGRVAAIVVSGMMLATGPLLENPRLIVPVTALPPDPLTEALRALEPGAVLVFPAPQAPWRQGQAPLARVQLALATAGRALPDAADPDAAATLLRLSQRVDAPVDTDAAKLAWSVRARDPFAPGAGADSASWRFLIVDYDGIPAAARDALDGWLAERVGVPIARAGSRALYDRR